MENARNIYRKATLIMVAILFVTICTTYIYFICNIGRVYEKHAVESIVDVKKEFLKSIVDNLIVEIELTQSREEAFYDSEVKNTSQILNKYYDMSPDNYQDLFIKFSQIGESKDYLSVLIKEIESGEIIYKSGIYQDGNPERTDFFSYFKESYSQYEISFGVSNDYIHKKIKSQIRDRIHCQEFAQDSYMWVDEIIDYNGGKNYAIRVIHPSLPDTEGQYLSSDTQDVMGAYPYEEELKGIKEHGEIFFNYHFKKPNTEVVSEKITYAKQYEKYNWVIAMGVHLDDIESYISLATEDQNKLIKTIIWQTIIFMLAVFILYWLFLSKIEKWYYKKYNNNLKEMFIDPLTKAKNRRSATTQLERAFKKFKKTGQSPMLMIIDIDDFKVVNDTFGHLEGDLVLKSVVRVIKDNIRAADTLYRWGGEEFILICNDLDKKDVFEFCNMIISNVGSKEYEFEGEKYHATISVGIDQFVSLDKTYEDAIKRADAAMYTAKEQGKNRACLGDMCSMNPLIKY